MELILDIFNQVLVPAFLVLASGLVTYCANYIRKVYTTKVTNQEVREIVDDVVLYVEQKFTDIKGTEKYNKAVDRIDTLLKEKGLTISIEEVETLIESSVYTLTDSLKTE